MGQVCGLIAGIIVLSSVTSGCGDDTRVLTVRIDDAVRVALKDGDGPWQLLAPSATGRVDVEITNVRYGLAFLCSSDGYLDTKIQWSTSRDEQYISCGISYVPVALTGVTAPGAKVFGDSGWQARVDSAGTYSLWVQAGLHDVFAFLPGTPARLLVERAVDVSSARVLDLPVVTEGVEMPTMTPTIVGAIEPVTVYSDLKTAAGTWVLFEEAPATVLVPPSSVLISSDQAAIGAFSAGCVTQQQLREESATLEMPGAFGVQFDRTTVSWEADAGIAWEYAWLSLSETKVASNMATRVYLSASATAEWFEASGTGDALDVPDVLALPGWPTETSFTAQGDVDWTFLIAEGDRAGDYHECGGSGSVPW